MNLKPYNIRILITIQVILFFFLSSNLIIGCNPRTKHRVLSFFFDGVPPLDQSEKLSAADSLAQTARTDEIQIDSSIVVQPTWSSHPILDKGECATCHDQKQSFRLYAEPEKLCIGCHDLVDTPVIHSPVKAGTCTECHNPHGSLNPYMLTVSVDSLCFKCHNDTIDITSSHKPVETGACIECHNSHGSNHPYLLAQAVDTLCFKCHDRAKIKPSDIKYIHAPVESGECLDCHISHGTANKFLLKDAGRQLCYQCHDQKDVKSKQSHQDIEQTVCHECHAPHSSIKEYLIR